MPLIGEFHIQRQLSSLYQGDTATWEAQEAETVRVQRQSSGRKQGTG